MLTDEVAGTAVLALDAAFAIFQSLQSDNQATIRAALEAAFNMTLLNEDKVKGNYLFLSNGGLPWLVSGIQKSYKNEDFHACTFGFKTLA